MYNKTTLYMCVTADKYELPLIVGDSSEVAKYAGITTHNLYSLASKKTTGRNKGYKIVRVEVREE